MSKKQFTKKQLIKKLGTCIADKHIAKVSYKIFKKAKKNKKK